MEDIAGEKRTGKSRGMPASLTVEAAFAVPLAFFALYAFMYLFLLIHVELRVYQAMHAASDRLYYLGTAAAYAEQSTIVTDLIEAAKSDVPEYAEELSSDIVSFLNGKLSAFYVGALIKNEMGSGLSLNCIRGDIDCSRSKAFGGDGKLHLETEFTFCYPFSLFSLTDRKVVLCLDTAAFYGTAWKQTAEFDDSKKREEDGNPDEITVYVTKNGEVYHRNENCTYINIKIEAVDYDDLWHLRSSDGSKYYPCSECEAGGVASGTIYITAYGTRYHSRENCPNIERNPEALDITEAENRGYRPCKKCGEG